MRKVRFRAPVALAAVVLVACGGGRPSAQPTPEDVREPAARAADADRKAPVVRMQAGTDIARGIALLSCVGKRCEERDGDPARYLKLAGRGIVLFMSGERLRNPRLEVSGADGDIVGHERLRDGSTIAYAAASLRRGRYRLSLEAGWEGGRGRWLFGLKVPSTLE